jgi:phosphoenolpyruvate carboxykinase (ATP)
MALHPSFLVLLTSDMTGTVPIMSKLTPEQAIFHFALGYSHDLLEESGKVRPRMAFYPCFDEARKALPELAYVKLFKERIETHQPEVYLFNTGYFGGKYG